MVQNTAIKWGYLTRPTMLNLTRFTSLYLSIFIGNNFYTTINCLKTNHGTIYGAKCLGIVTLKFNRQVVSLITYSNRVLKSWFERSS